MNLSICWSTPTHFVLKKKKKKDISFVVYNKTVIATHEAGM